MFTVTERIAVVVVERILGAPNRKIDIEDGLECRPVLMILDQRCAERVLEGRAVTDRNGPHGLHRIEVHLEVGAGATVRVEVALLVEHDLVEEPAFDGIADR